MSFIQGQVFKKVLLNGLTVLVNPMNNIPKVSVELWYHVGSKDEKTGEKGMAHLIEHMIFKGTEKLSESDINTITHKLSGYTNAFTSHDATGYIYQFPSQHWEKSFSLLADCMRNARFDEQMLNSELKAVIQELKMYKDRYVGQLVDELLSAVFNDHPYHYPIIGFKQDLWNLKRQTLVDFYHKHYVPNNATLVVVGDVEPEEVFELAQKEFGAIQEDKNYQKESFYHGKDLVSKEVVLYRDVKQPVVVMAGVLPGAKTKKQYVFDVLSSLLGSGKSSRLTKKLVDELQLVTALETFHYDLEDATPFFIYFEPKDIHEVQKIKDIIHQEIDAIVKNGVTQKELARATRKAKTAHLAMLEKQSRRANAIGQNYLFTRDENFIFNYCDYVSEDIEREVKELLVSYFSPSVMHCGKVLPLQEHDKTQWRLLQELSDTEDAKILDGRTRENPIEQPRSACSINGNAPKAFHFPRPQKSELSSGLKVFVHNNKELPKIDIVLTFKARSDYDPEDLQGLYAFMCDMLIEGTKNYPGTSIADELEEYGMSLSVEPGSLRMSMLSQDFEKGLELLAELLNNATFEEAAIEKIRDKFLSDLSFFWDEPHMFSGQLIRETVYKGHPFAKNSYGTFESIKKISQQKLKEFYSEVVSSKGARIAVVGDLHKYNTQELLEKYLGSWGGPEVKSLEYPAVKEVEAKEITYPINRDQVVLAFARPSVARLDKDYDKLSLFEQIFSSSGMSSRLFQLRERSGLFYTITGSLTAHANEQPGFFVVQTIVSLDRLQEAEKVIKETIDTTVDSLTEDELFDAKQAIINAQVNNFARNKTTGSAFLALDRYKFPEDYFDTRAQVISAITLDEVKDAARKFLDSSKMITFKIGRVQ